MQFVQPEKQKEAYADYVNVGKDDYIKDRCSPWSYRLEPCIM
jgi:hypothetical protein